MDTDIIYDVRWSDEADEKFIADFIATENEVFKNGYSTELFKKKYIDNIYGKSVVEVVYINGNPEAARGLWRNDLDGKAAYQPADTCVTEACRGKGVFIEMTKRSIAMLSEDDIIYNFPNQNSFPGYMKMGWKLIGEYGLVLFCSPKKYFAEHPKPMDKEYADWWISENDGFLRYKSGGHYFLVRPLGKPLCYKICACVDEETAMKFPKASFGMKFYRSRRNTFYNKKLGLPLHVVSKSELENVPLWKIDAL